LIKKGLFCGDPVFPRGLFGWLVDLGSGLGLAVFLRLIPSPQKKHYYMAIEGNFKNRQGHRYFRCKTNEFNELFRMHHVFPFHVSESKNNKKHKLVI